MPKKSDYKMTPMDWLHLLGEVKKTDNYTVTFGAINDKTDGFIIWDNENNVIEVYPEIHCSETQLQNLKF